jgi:hypothetical protein
MLTPLEQQTWQGPQDFAGEFEPQEPNPEAQLSRKPICPRCGRVMILIGSWRPAPQPPTPTQPRAP